MNKLLKQMLRIRMIEEAIARKYSEQQMRCPVHLSIGQEAPAVGVCAALFPKDKMVSTHRGHAHYLAKGGSLVGLIGELYGKSVGCSKGNGGSMHLIDLEANFWGSTSIVAQTIPIGVGLAFADRIHGNNAYTVICFGDAAVEEGVFHEAANFAGLHKLNVLFVCENNLYSCFTRITDRQPKRDFKRVASAHGLNWTETGKSLRNIYQRAKIMRSLPGPSFIEIPTYRFLEHCGPNNDDHLDYRPKKEIAQWKSYDKLKGLSDPVIENEIAAAFDYVDNSPPPTPNEFGKYIYAQPIV